MEFMSSLFISQRHLFFLTLWLIWENTLSFAANNAWVWNGSLTSAIVFIIFQNRFFTYIRIELERMSYQVMKQMCFEATLWHTIRMASFLLLDTLVLKHTHIRVPTSTCTHLYVTDTKVATPFRFYRISSSKLSPKDYVAIFSSLFMSGTLGTSNRSGLEPIRFHRMNVLCEFC